MRPGILRMIVRSFGLFTDLKLDLFVTICTIVHIYVRNYILTYLHRGLFRSQIEPVMNNLHTLQSAKSTQDWAIFLPKDLVAK